jgi:hypothetical protein
VRSGLRHLTLEALAEATPLGQFPVRLCSNVSDYRAWLLLLLLLQVRSGLRRLTLEALAEATPLGQRATALRESSKVMPFVLMPLNQARISSCSQSHNHTAF